MTRNLIELFIKDYDIPIKYIDEEHSKFLFDYIDSKPKLKKSFGDLTKFVNRWGEECFTKLRKDVADFGTNYIGELTTYAEFNAMDIQSKYPIVPSILGVEFHKGLNIYEEPNVGRTFISIDMKEANFQVFKFTKVISSPTYELFIANSIVPYDLVYYFTNSKNTRQVIFGKLNSPRQQHIERYLMQSLVEYLIKTYKFETEDFYAFTHDEIILYYNDRTSRFFVEDEITLNHIDLHVEAFELRQLKPYQYFVKQNIREPFDFKLKCVPSTYFAQAYKHYTKQLITDDDLYFVYEGNLAKFVKPLW